jgi:hypothetical protein
MNDIVKAHRAQVLQFQDIVAAMPQEENRPLDHYFAHRVYVRSLTTPAGTVSIGKLHKYSQVNALLKGRVSIKTPEGVIERTAPCIWVSPAGTKNISYFHEDTIWISAHGTDETDMDKLEEEQICSSYEEFDKLEVL